MKIKSDPRHQRRIKLIKQLFAWQFNSRVKPSTDLKPLIESLDKIDALIEKSAPLWPIKQINKIDLAILRLAIFELLLNKEPEKVVIDEAIELAKQYGSEGSPGFINGVLGDVLKNV